MLKTIAFAVLCIGGSNEVIASRAVASSVCNRSVGRHAERVLQPGFVLSASVRFDKNPAAEAAHRGEAAGFKRSGEAQPSRRAGQAFESAPQVKIRHWMNIVRGEPQCRVGGGGY
jgi:hypothetical protein